MSSWWLLIIVVLALVVWFARSAARRRGDAAQESPEQMLKRRYAAGEMDRETYERMLEDLRPGVAEENRAQLNGAGLGGLL